MANSKTADGPTIEFNMSLERFISTCFLVPIENPIEPSCIWGLPVMLHGSPGIGKSARVRQASRALDLTCKTVELGGRQPEDAGGAPFVTENEQGQKVIVIACILPAVNELNALGEGVLFLDELTCARPATQGAFLACVQERRVGDTQFSQKIRIVCAGNPPNQSAGGYPLQLPMANRMAHRDVPAPSVRDFITYMIQGPNRDVEDLRDGEKKIIDGWPEHYAKTVGHLAGFLEKFPHHLDNIPKSGHPSRGKAYSAPRSVDYATRAVATARILGRNTSDQTEMFAACCGVAAAVDWETWMRNSDLPDPAHVLEHGWKPDKIRLDRTMAVYSGLVAHILGQHTKQDREKLSPKAWPRINDLILCGLPDLALNLTQTMVRAGLASQASKECADAAKPLLLYFAKKDFHLFVEGT